MLKSIGSLAASSLALAAPLLLSASLASAAPEKPAAASETRRDPKGLSGISPYQEALAKGRSAHASKQAEAAIVAFDAAIAEDVEKPEAYLLKAQALLGLDKISEALSAAETGAGKQAASAMRAKLLMLIAVLKERAPAHEASKSAAKRADKTESEAAPTVVPLKGVWEKVKEAYDSYLQLIASDPEAGGYKASAEDRKLKIDARREREKAYAVVAKRIKDNEAKRAKKAAKTIRK